MVFKDTFLELVQQVKEIGVMEKLRSTTTEDELKVVRVNFLVENSSLIEKIEAWDKAFSKARVKNKISFIFPDSTDVVEDAEEIALCIHYLPKSTEEEIFENDSNLKNSLWKLNNDFAKAVAFLMDERWICDITDETLFRAIDEINRAKYKEKFYEFIAEIKEQGLVDKLHKTTNAKEYRNVLKTSILRDEDFLERFHNWEQELLESGLYPIFCEEKVIVDPEEVVLCVSILQDFNEWDLFDDWGILQDSLNSCNSFFPVAIAHCMENLPINSILAEDVFDTIYGIKENIELPISTNSVSLGQTS